MEDLLASIRKAIHEDIGEMPATGRLAPPAPAPAPRASDQLAAAASEIQQLRDKIARARAGKPLPTPEPTQRAASLAAALQNDTPRRSWRDLEPPSGPRLRGTAVEPERVSPAPRVDAPAVRQMPPRTDAAAMLSEHSAQTVHSAFGKLAESVMNRATSDRSVEEVTRELLRVMLKQWLDENLPAMVERMVREEIERVARGR